VKKATKLQCTVEQNGICVNRDDFEMIIVVDSGLHRYSLDMITNSLILFCFL
jgi:hypothetical protein